MNDDFLDRLGAQLRVAAAAPLPAPARPARQHRPRLATNTRRLVTGALVALIATPALAITRPWEPILGHPGTDRGTPTASPRTAPADQARLLAVLRRPQTEEDRKAGALLVSLHPGFDGVETASVRLLRGGADGIALVPTERLYQDDTHTGQPIFTDALCLVDARGVTCGSREGLEKGRVIQLAGQRVYGLVPDGVAAVRVRVADGSTATAPVADNLFLVDSPRDSATVTSTTWLDADGRVVGGLQPKTGG